MDIAPATTRVITPPRTPTALTTSAHKLVSEIRDIYDRLSSLPSLAPGPQINGLLTRLVNLCIKPFSVEFTKCFFSINGVAHLCEQLRPLCASAEGELEKFWATQIIREAQSALCPSPKLLASFPYHQNYIDLSRLECLTLEAFLPAPPHKIAFIGSGPLPLTSLCMLDRHPKAAVHNIDRDAAALNISRQLCASLGYGSMSFACEDITKNSNTDWESFEVIFLAALVGTNTDSKMAILSSLASRLRPGTLVVARSAQGMRSVLYPVLELSVELERTGLEVLVEVHPWTKVVNSVVVMKVKKR
ncbi:Nicotianamine synthase [Ophiobolus disseminans]|uniref:Nicotianamine synthase n=1 Tax=Ophiobolus disseminans TaxID=1469910 RepID=A0A6A6ZN78_9PLEO|nr:Nicotianamine synthase [Ophiobolus disseminans]